MLTVFFFCKRLCEYISIFLFLSTLKDLSLAQSSSVESNSPTPLGSLAYNFYKQMSNQGFSKKDFAYVYEFMRSKQ